MFSKLKERWKVNEWQLLLIISTFALGGSACGYLGKKILSLTGLEKGIAWVIIYIIVITFLWPLCVLIISIPMGQFNFFKKYLLRIWTRIKGRHTTVTRVAIFASGAGSNAQKIIDHFKKNKTVEVALIVCNNPSAGVLSIARKENIPSLLIEKSRFSLGDAYVPEMNIFRIDFIILAGFLWKVPGTLISRFPEKIINIHPALLPKYGGKGMYGNKVHEAVITAAEKESGITIHYVDEIYDHGNIILQATCPINETDTPASLAQKVHALEHRHYPEVIEKLLSIPK